MTQFNQHLFEEQLPMHTYKIFSFPKPFQIHLLVKPIDHVLYSIQQHRLPSGLKKMISYEPTVSPIIQPLQIINEEIRKGRDGDLLYPGRAEVADAELLLVCVPDLLVQGRQQRARQSNPGSGPREVEARHANGIFKREHRAA